MSNDNASCLLKLSVKPVNDKRRIRRSQQSQRGRGLEIDTQLTQTHDVSIPSDDATIVANNDPAKANFAKNPDTVALVPVLAASGRFPMVPGYFAGIK